MSTSPVGPEDIRAAAEVHSELGPEYSDAVVASFLDKVEAEVAARVEARLAAASAAPAVAPAARGVTWFRRRPLAAGIIIGACATGLAVGAVTVVHTGHGVSTQSRAEPHQGPVHRHVRNVPVIPQSPGG
jgi:hypothetical protein